MATETANEHNSDASLREELDIPGEYPWRDEDVIRELYVEREMSLNEVADVLDGSARNISKWVKKHGFDTRSISEAKRDDYRVPYTMRTTGHAAWRPVDGITLVHRLLAVAKYGLDEIKGQQVHHKNEIPWDNRMENLEIMSRKEHSAHHSRKVNGLDRLRVAEQYENGDVSIDGLAEIVDHDICGSTVLAIHKEFYGGAAA